jgi:hypothetical protein
MKSLLVLTKIILVTVFAAPALALPLSSSSKPFTFDNATYSVRTIIASDEGAVIEVGFHGTDESGKDSIIYRQYRVLNSCRNPRSLSAYGFLGEHEVNDFGVVTFSNPQPEGTTIPANSGIGKVVGAAFTASCRN